MEKVRYIKVRVGQAPERRRVSLRTWLARLNVWTVAWYAFLTVAGVLLYKLGAAPTYIKKGGSVQRLSGKSLPAGLAEGEPSALDQFSLRLNPGDCVLMVSDGVCSGLEDGWLREELNRFDGASPKDLARELVTRDPKDATDDRTALVVRVDRRT